MIEPGRHTSRMAHASHAILGGLTALTLGVAPSCATRNVDSCMVVQCTGHRTIVAARPTASSCKAWLDAVRESVGEVRRVGGGYPDDLSELTARIGNLPPFLAVDGAQIKTSPSHRQSTMSGYGWTLVMRSGGITTRPTIVCARGRD
jgi:hypothetical protein